MPPPTKSKETGGRLTGEDMNNYFESFADRFLKGKILFNVEVLNVSRNPRGGWSVLVNNKLNGLETRLHYDKIVVCTGVGSFLALLQLPAT
jgi:dimethylaniline monooxygenase (N-oxide forming)